MDIPQGLPREADGGRCIRQARIHEYHIGGVDRDVSPVSDRHTDVGTCESRGVIDAVADHENMPALCQLPDSRFLPFREDPR